LNSLQPNDRKRDPKQMNSNAQSENKSEAVAVSQADLTTLEMWISRYRRVLYFVAYRVLGNHTDAEDALQSCMQSIRRKIPSLEHEGGFRASVVRVLIDEALVILRKNRLRSSLKGPVSGPLIKQRSGHHKESASWTVIWSCPDGTSSAGGWCR
jgi:DNA-directed RNA polymerase specialized sigma24 family protein